MPSGEDRPLRVFVSSTFIDNHERRKVVEDAILSAGLVPVGMERFTASTLPTVEECTEQVRGCDWLIGILAYRYGWIPSGQPEGEERSITEMEYEAAKAAGMPRLMFVLDGSIKVDPNADFDQGPERWKKQEKLDAFKARAGADQMPAVFREETLGTRVLQAIFEERQRQAKQTAGRQRGAPGSGSSGGGDRGGGSDGGDDDDGGPVPREELRRYLAKAESLHQDVPLVGFKTKARLSMQLHELYVPLDAMIDRGGRGREVNASGEVDQKLGAEGMHLRSEQIPLAEAFTRARTMKRRGLVLLGDPGSGKTTHLKQVLLKVVREGPESIGLPSGTVPVFLRLRSLEDREAGLPGLIAQELRDPALATKPDLGARLCERGRLLLLLDGLDEVANAEERAAVARWIEAALRGMPDSYVLVSCRYAGYSDKAELNARFLELHLRPFDDEQMEAFVTRWYTTVERELWADSEQAIVQARTRSAELLAVLKGSEISSVARLYQMTRNPLLLTTICLVHRDLGRLPTARAKLYEESIAVLLERWRERPFEGKRRLVADEAVEVLQPVAEWMHGKSGRTRATKAELLEPVGKALAKLRHVQVSAEGFLRAIRDESGLLTGWGVDEYGFMHLGFQEYLVAQHLRNVGVAKPGELWALARRFGDSWWQEVILLMLAQRNPSVFEQFMRALVRQPGFDGWHESPMMRLCMGEAAVPSSVPFVELLGVSAGDGDPEELGRRQLAAAQVLAWAMPEEMKGLAATLQEHPAEAVRRWWWEHERQERQAQGGEVIVAPRGGVELVLIPGGTFLMGSPEGVGLDSERPQHEVELASFYLARTPVTNAQYGEYLKAKPGVAKPEYWGNRQFNQPEQPVVGVSWEDAKAYCEWAGLLLPTEAQWEYACRAATPTKYSFGDDAKELDRFGWYDGNSGNQPHPVAQKEPNGFGLYDMHGNVLEWCMDAVGPYTTSPRAGDGLRVEPEGVAFRVMRGGGFFNVADVARSASRVGYGPGLRGVVFGFRPAQGHP